MSIPTQAYRQQAGCIPVALLCTDGVVLLLGLLTRLACPPPDDGAAAFDKPLKGLASPLKELMLLPAGIALLPLTPLLRTGGGGGGGGCNPGTVEMKSCGSPGGPTCLAGDMNITAGMPWNLRARAGCAAAIC